jgi:Fur family peroxide stress response transcriptional regulator
MNRRFSTQKKMIEEALRMLDHPTAAEVYEEIWKAYPQISLGTIYRNLNTMASEGEIMRLSFSGSPDRFDPNAAEHYHIVCTRCGRILDTDDSIPQELLNQLDQTVESSTGVEVEGRTMLFYGICPACKEN